MNKEISDALNINDPLHDKLLAHCKRLVEMSRAYMFRFYDLWDVNDSILRGERKADDTDRKAAQRGEPPKIILPFSYAQVQTFIAYFSMLFTQRDVFYEIQGTGPLDEGTPELDMETVLQRDLRRSCWSRILYQNFLDIARTGFCVVKHTWEEESQEVPVTTPLPATPSVFGGMVPPSLAETTQTVYSKQGNKLMSVNPYKFFPDVRLPLSRMQEGEFCAVEDEYSITRLKQMQGDGAITNVDEIRPLGTDALNTRRVHFMNAENNNALRVSTTDEGGGGMCIVSEWQGWIVPKDFTNASGETPFGDSDKPEFYLVWYANDKTIIRAEPMNYAHNQFTFDVAEYSADQLRVINEGLCEIIDPMQSICTWLLNSHVSSVRKMIDTKVVVDPQFIEMKDLESRSPVIRLKPGASRSGVDMFIKQLNVQDATQNHIAIDIPAMKSNIEYASGLSENAQGQYSKGRRDATQSKAVNAGASMRLKMQASVVWETLYAPLGVKLMNNHQQNLAFEEFCKCVGIKKEDPTSQARFTAFQGSGDAEYELEFFDGTSPSEKAYVAQSMQDLLLGLMENPQTAMMLSQEPFRSLVVEIADLRGIRSPERFLPPPQITPPPALNEQSNQSTPPGGSPTVVPAAA